MGPLPARAGIPTHGNSRVSYSLLTPLPTYAPYLATRVSPRAGTFVIARLCYVTAHYSLYSPSTHDLLLTLYLLVQPPHEYFAEKLREAMKGIGSDKDEMTEAVVFRKERDLSPYS